MQRHFAVLFLSVLVAVPAQTPIDLFQQEAETSLGRPIRILESDEMGMSNGQTFCDQNPVLIKLRKGLEPGLRDQILAHELGHALLCARGILTHSRNTDTATEEGISGIVGALGSTIGSCYIDPLADAEARRRGFKADKRVEQLLRKVGSHTKEEIHYAVNRFGDLSAELSAIAIYCSELDYQSLPISEIEKVYESEPSVIMKLQALRRDLGRPHCSDGASCFTLTKRLRDEFGLGRLIVIWNSGTSNFE
jgi:hypothetical protein